MFVQTIIERMTNFFSFFNGTYHSWMAKLTWEYYEK